MLTVDGGPGEHPRYQKVITVAVQHFLQHDFDALSLLPTIQEEAHLLGSKKMAPLKKNLLDLYYHMTATVI